MILSENSDVLNCTVPPLRVESSELKHPISPMTMWPPSANRDDGWPHIPPIYRHKPNFALAQPTSCALS
jgi:hypothetical protein